MTNYIGLRIFPYFYFHGTDWYPKSVHIFIGPKYFTLGPKMFVVTAQSTINKNRVVNSRGSSFIHLRFLFRIPHSICIFPSGSLDNYIFATRWSHKMAQFNVHRINTNVQFLKNLQCSFFQRTIIYCFWNVNYL